MPCFIRADTETKDDEADEHDLRQAEETYGGKSRALSLKTHLLRAISL